MKSLSLFGAVGYSIVVLSLAIFVVGLESGSGLSYGWLEHFYMRHYYLYCGVSAVFVLLSGLMVSNILMLCGLRGNSRSYLPMVLYSSVMALTVGMQFLYVSIAGLYIVFSLYVIISKSRNTEPLSGFLFKMVLAAFLLSILHTNMLWIVLQLVVVIIYFRASIAKDLSAILFSFLLFSLYVAWIFWYFDLNFSLYSAISLSRSAFGHYLAIGMLVFAMGSWIAFRGRMTVMDSMACKMEQYSLLLIAITSALVYFFGVRSCFLLLYAVHASFVVHIHRESLSSKKLKRIVLWAFFLIVLAVALVPLYEALDSPLDYVKGLYGRFWYVD